MSRQRHTSRLQAKVTQQFCRTRIKFRKKISTSETIHLKRRTRVFCQEERPLRRLWRNWRDLPNRKCANTNQPSYCYHNIFHWQIFVMGNNTLLSEASWFLITAAIAPRGKKTAGMKPKLNLLEKRVRLTGLQPQPGPNVMCNGPPGLPASISASLPAAVVKSTKLKRWCLRREQKGTWFQEVIRMVLACLTFSSSFYLPVTDI